MKNATLLFMLLFSNSHLAVSQEISLPKLYDYRDTTKNYYITGCEEYYSLFGYNFWNHYPKQDSCPIDFLKYDVAGTKRNDTLRWYLVSPKKYMELEYKNLRAYDTIQWKVFPDNMVVNDSTGFDKLIKNTNDHLVDTFNFEKMALVYNDVWIDCSGHFYYKILYDPIDNEIVCNQIGIYGGSRGMCPRDSWIIVYKPRPDTRIELKGIWIH